MALDQLSGVSKPTVLYSARQRLTDATTADCVSEAAG